MILIDTSLIYILILISKYIFIVIFMFFILGTAGSDAVLLATP